MTMTMKRTMQKMTRMMRTNAKDDEDDDGECER